jgi:hypothetical protein
MVTPYVHTLYCDDIRYEHDGKITFVGAINGLVVLETYPASIPKLCVCVWTVLPIDCRPKSIVTRITLGDNEISSQEITNIELPDRLTFPVGLEVSGDSEFSMINFNQHFVLCPLNVDGPSALRVSSVVDGQVLKGGTLYFAKSTAEARELAKQAK